MSLFPYVFREMARPLRMLEHQMRLAENAVYPALRNKNRFFVDVSDGAESVALARNKNKFQVKLDVKNFSPHEIVVKTVNDDSIVIEAKQEITDWDGSISRQFFRKFVLSKSHDLKNVKSNLSTDGILTVTARNKGSKAITHERLIPITYVNFEGQK